MHCSLSTTGGSENDVTVTTHVNSKQRFYHNYLFPRIDSGDEELFTTRNCRISVSVFLALPSPEILRLDL